MAKYANPDVIDGALNVIKNNATRMTLCTTQPTTFAEANATYSLAQVAMASGDFTLANGDTSGRKVTVAAKSGVSVATSGTVTHAALLDVTNSKLLFVTTTPSTAVAGGGTVDIGSWKDEIQAPI
ncbi:hypothetical protein [Brevundimonas vesicularis]|uniref:hypothetical protein n=1 Tax=Brevundimonas vesicularis TaxID=41276 RepID=UPI0028AA5871|nr:hypothetical protein [Brevundimonas vesicularis]